MLQAIETEYQGYLFRSRIEARYAVFFDALYIQWEYEKEGYNLDGTYYLPDFWLPKLQWWVEVKGQYATEKEYEKAHLLAAKSSYPVMIVTGKDMFGTMLYPDQRLCAGAFAECDRCKTIDIVTFIDRKPFYDRGIDCQHGYRGTPKIFAACEAFKKARFEHGQKGWR
jgi:hypothetical protein